MQQYDISAKVLMESCRDDIIRYLMDLPVKQSRILKQLPQETPSLKRSDFPIMVTDREGNEQMVIIEIQTEWRRSVPLNLIDYRVRYLLKYNVESTTCVLLLRPSASATDRYEDKEIRFCYRLVKIYEMDARTVVAEGPLCMLPFVPLMRGGGEALDEAEALIYGSEKTRPQKADMLTTMAIMSGLISADMPAKLIARRKDIMIESAAYDLIKNEGYSEGKAAGIEEGREEMKMQTARKLLLLGPLTDEQIALATDLSVEEVRRLKQGPDPDASDLSDDH